MVVGVWARKRLDDLPRGKYRTRILIHNSRAIKDFTNLLFDLYKAFDYIDYKIECLRHS